LTQQHFQHAKSSSARWHTRCRYRRSIIAIIDQDDFSSPQLQAWNTLWQQAGKDRPYLQIALCCLAAAVQVLTSTRRSDRPLFQLTPEIRHRARPLLTKNLGAVTTP